MMGLGLVVVDKIFRRCHRHRRHLGIIPGAYCMNNMCGSSDNELATNARLCAIVRGDPTSPASKIQHAMSKNGD